MTEKQCRSCKHLKFFTDYYDHVDCESKDLYYNSEGYSYASSMFEDKHCPFHEEKKYDGGLRNCE